MSKPRNRITRLILKEISAVDVPAQIGATAPIMKRGTPVSETIAKAFVESTAPTTFVEMLSEEQRQQERWKIQDKLWPLYDALRSSISNVVAATKDLPAAMPQIEVNVAQFLDAVRAELPEIEQDVTKALVDFALHKSQNTGESAMKTAEQLTADLQASAAQIETLTKSLATATALASLDADDLAFVAKSKMSDKDKEEFAKLDPKERKEKVKKSLDSDESFEFDGQTITKSAVGDGTFAVLKSMRARQDAQEFELRKAAELHLETTLKSRISTEFDKLPGDEAAKLSVLKAAHKLPEADRTALEAMLKAGNAALGGAFGNAGASRGAPDAAGGATSVHKSAERSLSDKTDEIQKARGIKKRSDAYEIAVKENPELVAQLNS